MLNSIHPQWKSFPISEIFNIYPGKRLTKNDMIPGDRPFIGATDSNNGITEWVSNSNDSLDSNVLGVNYNGSVCETFYHPYECIFSDDVKRLHLKDHSDSKYIMLFLKTILLQQKCKYAYGYKFNEQRMLRQTIVLPVDNEGNPDWTFMEEYMRKQENKLLKPIIEKLCNRLIANELTGGGNLDNCNWVAFQLDELFDIKATKSSIDKKNLVKGEGTIPYITRTDKNNGIDMFVCEQPNYETDEGNVITIGLDTQTVFYQSVPFYTGQNIQVLRHPALNRYVASFILIPIKNLMDKFNWGGNGATLSRLKRSKILLPANDDRTPNWGFMERFMRDVENDVLASTLSYFKGLQSVNKCEMGGGVIWKPLRLSKLFDYKKGNQNNMADLVPGMTPLVSAKKFDNGYKGFVTPNNKGTYEGNIITLNLDGDGGAGLAYYQPFEMALDSHVGALKPKVHFNRYHLLFISMCISKQQDMYGHGHSINESRLKGYRIMLPFDEHDNLFLDYMESIMRNIENQQIYSYLIHQSNISMSKENVV